MRSTGCLTLFGLLLIAAVPILVTGCSQDMASAPEFDINSKEHAMISEHQIESSTADIAPMDAAAPTVFETASFGLG